MENPASRSKIALRKASPTRKDGLRFARFLDIAAEGFFKVLIGKNATDVVAEAFLQKAHDLSYQHVTFAEEQGEIIGMVLAYAATERGISSQKVLIDASTRRRQRLRLKIVFRLIAPMTRVIESIEEDEYYLQAIAVTENRHKSGIGSVLMDHADALAVKHGSKRLSLDVSAKNINAIKFYEKRGFYVTSKWPKRFSVPSFSFLRMTKQIDSSNDVPEPSKHLANALLIDSSHE